MSKMQPDKGWSWMVLIAAFLGNVTFDGIIFSFGVFYLEFLDAFQVGRGPASWIGSVISAVYALIGPLASVLANKFGCRAVTIVGSLIAATGFILCTFSPNIHVMILTYGVMGGIGFGFMYLCCYVMIGHFFEKYRALATGIASCGSGVGTFIFAPLSVALIDNFGWKGAMWIIAGVVLNGVVIGMVFQPIDRIQSGSEIKDECEKQDTKSNINGSDCEIDKSGKESSSGKSSQKLIDMDLLKNPAFMIFCFSSFLCLIGFFVPFIYLPDFARKHGIPKEKGAFLLSIIGISNMAGRIFCGAISDRPWADALKIYNAALIVGGTATVAAAWLKSYALLAVYAVVFGVSVAAYVSLCAIILVEFLGLEKLSNSFGFLNMFRGIATFIGAPLAGFLYDSTGDYQFAFYVAGASIAVAGIICLPLRQIPKCDGERGRIVSQYDHSLAVAEMDIQEMSIKLDQDKNLTVLPVTRLPTHLSDSLSSVTGSARSILAEVAATGSRLNLAGSTQCLKMAGK